MKRRVVISLSLAMCALACSAETAQHVSCRGTQPPPRDLARAERVIIITVDGLRPDLIDRGRNPTLRRMIREGAYSLRARTVWPSLTLAAHTSLLSGLPPEEHGVWWNHYNPFRGTVDVTTIFHAAHAAGLGTAVFAGKDKLRHLLDPQVLDHGNAFLRSDEEVMDEALDFIVAHRPSLVLIHLPGVDNAGHEHGWMSDAQRDALRTVDDLLGRLLRTLGQHGLRKRTLLIVTSDHGGEGHLHSNGSLADLTIPWIAWGAGVEARELPAPCLTATAGVALRALGLEPPAVDPGRSR